MGLGGDPGEGPGHARETLCWPRNSLESSGRGGWIKRGLGLSAQAAVPVTQLEISGRHWIDGSVYVVNIFVAVI